MRIGIFTNNYLPNPYGVTGSIESFRKEFEKKGHTVYIFAPFWRGYTDKNPNVFRYPSISTNIKVKFPLPIPYSRKMDNIIRNLDLDIIHSQHPNFLGVVAMKWARKKKIPLVFTWHTLYDRYTDFVPFVPSKLAAKWIIKKAVEYADKVDQVIVPTDSVKEIIQNWGIGNKNIQTIPSGIESDAYQDSNREKIRKNLQIKDDEILLLTVSRMTSEKNIEFLFNSVIGVLKKNKKVKFICVGGGYFAGGMKELVEKEGVSDRVFFTGEIGRDHVKDHYAAADMFVYASKSETQGMIISEAMYMHLPIVAVRATGVRDLVENNVNGFLVSENEEDFIEAIERLISDKELRDNFSQKSGEIAREKYISAKCADRLLAAYESLVK